jgi:DNA polymerase-3 subunit alpha
VRDTGRVLGMPFGQVNKVAELIPNNPAKPVTLAQAVDGEPRLQEMRDSDEAVARLLEVATRIEGLYRHASTHAAGVVIGDRPLVDLVPLYRDPKSDFLVTQYSMKHVEQAGLVKFDFLGLTTLTILRRAEEFLAGLGARVDFARLPLDDKKTYEMLARGDAGGVFQMEGQGMRDTLRQMRPDRLEDLVAAVALYRPGPMDNIPEYCKRKHGKPWEAPHPEIHDILAETYGIMVYQEQVMQIAQRMAGYSLGGADLLRRAMGKKIASEMEAQRGIFVDGATKRGVPRDKAVEVFDLMAKFADYGFNKSHAAAYALVAYQTAWLKANHPAVFFASCMSLAIANTDRLATLKQDAERAGVKILPPDINKSGADFAVEKLPDGTLAIRYALAAVKKVGLSAMKALAEARGTYAFDDLGDFAARIDPRQLNKMQIENLVRAGAFDGLEGNRARVFAVADTLLRRAQLRLSERDSGQIGLFGAGANRPEEVRLPESPDWAPLDRLSHEADAVGFHLTAHPLDAYGAALKRLAVAPAAKLEAIARGGPQRVRIAGTVVGSKERITRTGSRMAWVRVTDATGSVEVTCFSEVLSRSRELLSPGSNVLFHAELKPDGESFRITANGVEALDKAAADAPSSMRIWLRRESGGRGKVLLMPRLDGGRDVEIALPGTYNVTPRLAQALKALPGVEQVEQG